MKDIASAGDELCIATQNQEWRLGPGVNQVGRDPAGQVVFADSSISWHHAEVRLDGRECWIRDLGSTNGTRLNGVGLQKEVWTALKSGDALELGSTSLHCAVKGHVARSSGTEVLQLRTGKLLIGRDPTADWPISNPHASWHHCEIVRAMNGAIVRDLDSTNGTFVNGARVAERRLIDGDVLSIAGSRLRFSDDQLHREGITADGRMDVVRLTQRARQAARLLVNDVSFSAQPNQLVAIVGASGAGKSSLLNSITGYWPATSGWVLLDGMSYLDHIDELKTRIGYVPQEDVVSPELTVERVMWHAAKLRLPPDTSGYEIRDRIQVALDELGLRHRAHAQVKTLSGGERKRVNVAVELLGDPRYLLLDEPTTGLDPGTERQIMELLSRLSSQGRTIILVTHATENITVCDRVLFLAPGGVPVYFGPPQLAPGHFGVSSFADIYNAVNSESEPESLRQAFVRSELYRQYVVPPLTSADGRRTTLGGDRSFARRCSLGWHQFVVLSKRYLEELVADRRNLLLLLAQAPIIAVLTALLFSQDPFALNQSVESSATGKIPLQSAPTLLFLSALTCIWCGTNTAAREIVKERRMFRRERMAGLGILPYFTSKLAILGALTAFQAAALWLVLSIGVNFHISSDHHLVLLGWMIATSWSAMGLGLLVSSLAKSPDQAGSLLPILLVPQVLLGGLLIPLEEMGPVGPLSSLSPSRWSFSGLSATVDLDQRFMDAGLKDQMLQAFQTPWWQSVVGLLVLLTGFMLTSILILRYNERLRA